MEIPNRMWVVSPLAFQWTEGRWNFVRNMLQNTVPQKITSLCDSGQCTDPSLQSVTPLLVELMTLKKRGAVYSWNMSLILLHKSTLLQPSALPLMYVCPPLSLGALLSLSWTSRKLCCHTASLLDYPHRVRLWPLSSCDDTELCSQVADLTRSLQCAAIGHMPASPEISTQR